MQLLPLMRISAHERCKWSGKKSDVGLIRIMPADGTVAALTPAKISASFSRQRQPADSLYRFRGKRNDNVWAKHCDKVSDPDPYDLHDGDANGAWRMLPFRCSLSLAFRSDSCLAGNEWTLSRVWSERRSSRLGRTVSFATPEHGRKESRISLDLQWRAALTAVVSHCQSGCEEISPPFYDTKVRNAHAIVIACASNYQQNAT